MPINPTRSDRFARNGYVLLAVLAIPTMVTIIWMSIFGMNAIEQAQAGIGSLANGVSSISLATFQMLENLPLAGLTTVVMVLMTS